MYLQKLQLHWGPDQVSTRTLNVSRSEVFLYVWEVCSTNVWNMEQMFLYVINSITMVLNYILLRSGVMYSFICEDKKVTHVLRCQIMSAFEHLSTQHDKALSLDNFNVGILALDNRVS